MKEERSFIEWEPAISPEQVFSDVVRLGEIKIKDENLYYLEMRPSERGRCLVVRIDKEGKIKDITPKNFNVRNRVHEYGGGVYDIFGNSIYFVNFSDQRIYYQKEDSFEVSPITPPKNKDGSLGKYASLNVSPNGKKLIFVYEKEYPDKENENFLGVLDIEEISEPKIIVKGSNFYADPIFSPDGKRIAYLQWNHPNMPWDSTELMIGKFENGEIKDIKKVDGGENKSICFPKFDKKGNLFYIMDEVVNNTSSPKNWWNIYCYDGNKTKQITFENAEFGEPHWVFGESNYDFLPDGKIIAKMLKNDKNYLVVIEPESKSLSIVEDSLSNYKSIKTDEKGKVFFIGISNKESAGIYSFDVNSRKLKTLKKSSNLRMEEDDISLPKSISYPTKDRKKSYAFFYSPKNKKYYPPKNDKPPLLVMVHGGPTSRTNGSFSFITQFWTSSGFAVIDINYRGSTGYGRKYRDELLNKWGIVDASDTADAIRFLIKEGIVNPKRIAIRGGSAGGYLVQRVMTMYPDLFKVGASYFGIGNLITLVKYTHKFESRYIDNLVGAKFPEGKSKYMERSPINHLNKLNSPMIIFQGSDDKIVPPDCSREMANVLKKKGIKYEYIEYKGETHGFRSKKSNVDSLKKEFDFYRKVFSLDH